MENIVFADGKCTIPGIVSLEAPLEAFGNVKLTNAFKELDNSKIRMVATAVGLTTREKNPAGEEVHVPDSEVFGMTMFTLQHAWFEAIPGGITKNAAKNYADRQEKYWAVLESIKAGTFKPVASNGAAKKDRKSPSPKSVSSYILNTAALGERYTKLLGDTTSTNHVSIILNILHGVTEPMTLEAICAACEATGRYTRKEGVKETLRQNVKYILDKFEVNGQVGVSVSVAPTPAPAPAPEQVTAKATTVATPAKPAAKPTPAMPVAQGTKGAQKASAAKK